MADLRVLVGSKIVYVAAAATEHASALGHLHRLTFEPAFRMRLHHLMQRIHARYGIAIDVCPDGDRRTFEKQFKLVRDGRKVTKAGPGESNHNFGQAADLGFKGLHWLREDGTVVGNETHWLLNLEASPRGHEDSLAFWELLRIEAPTLGLYRGPLHDRPHLQAWPDVSIDMADRLADLLTRSGRMRWAGRRQQYQCDLGFGGRLFDVGSAADIWDGSAAITLAMLTQARAQPRMTSPALAPVASGVTVAAQPATLNDLAAMRKALRAEFDAADAAWKSWRHR